MNTTQTTKIQDTLKDLFNDSKYDMLKMLRSSAKSILRPMQPSDFSEVYLSISKEQGEMLTQLIIDRNIKNIVEFGTSFGISTLFMAQGIIKTNGQIITTELIQSKANQAIQNFRRAGVLDHIDVRIGNAMETLQNHNQSIDLLFLDGWKDLYLPLFNLLDHNFHKNTMIYVDNADMSDVKSFLKSIEGKKQYQIKFIHKGKAALITTL